MTALTCQLRGGGQRASLGTLGPVAALEELGHACESAFGGSAPRPGDVESLLDDSCRALLSFGPEVSGLVNVHLEDLRELLVGKELRSVQQWRRVELARDAVLRRLAEQDVAAAAWDDAVSVFRRGDKPAEVGERRLLVLRELCELRGHGWFGRNGLSGGLTSLLTRRLYALPGEASEAAAAEDDVDAVERRRLEACRTLIGADLRRGDVAVWLLVREAAFEGCWRRVGPVQFFASEQLRSYPSEAQRELGAEPLEELAEWEEAASHLSLPVIDEPELVALARVWLPDTAVDGAESKAREIVGALLDVTRDRKLWQLQPGAGVYVTGRGWEPGGVEVPRKGRPRGAHHPAFSTVPDQLAAFDEGFIQRFADGDVAARNAMEDARSAVTVGEAPTAAQRVGLGIRALERALRTVTKPGDSWTVSVERYLLGAWSAVELRRWLGAVCVNVVEGIRKKQAHDRYLVSCGLKSADASLDGLDVEVEDWFWPDESISPTVRAERVAGLEKELGKPLENFVAKHAVEYRQVSDGLAVLSDPTRARALLATQEEQFGRLLKRSLRGRNAVLHGQRASDGALQSVDLFVKDLGRLAVQDLIVTASSGDEPMSALQRQRDLYRRCRSLLDTEVAASLPAASSEQKRRTSRASPAAILFAGLK